MRKVIQYGAGSLGECFFYEASMFGLIEICAFTVDQAYLQQNIFCGLPMVPFEKVKAIYPPEEYDMIVVGTVRMRARKRMFHNAKSLGYNLQSYISSRAIVEPGVKMGENTIIFSDAFIGHHAELGDNNMIRQKVYVGHQTDKFRQQKNPISRGFIVSLMQSEGQYALVLNSAKFFI